MGRLIPLADYVDPNTGSPWLRPREDPGDWDPCGGCPIRGACREVRECQWEAPPPPVPDLELSLVEPPDIVA